MLGNDECRGAERVRLAGGSSRCGMVWIWEVCRMTSCCLSVESCASFHSQKKTNPAGFLPRRQVSLPAATRRRRALPDFRTPPRWVRVLAARRRRRPPRPPRRQARPPRHAARSAHTPPASPCLSLCHGPGPRRILGSGHRISRPLAASLLHPPPDDLTRFPQTLCFRSVRRTDQHLCDSPSLLRPCCLAS